MKSILKTKIWLYVIIMSRTRFWVNLQSTVVWMSRDCSKQAQSSSHCNGTQSLAKWLRIRGCGFEFRCCHTINLKKYLDPRLGSSFGPLSIIFSVFSQKIWCYCHKQKKNDTLKAFTGISFFHVYEILRCRFWLKSMKGIVI